MKERSWHIESFLRKAGEAVASLLHKDLRSQEKMHGGDLQTEADLMVEEMFVDYLGEHFSGEDLLGEENTLSHRYLEEDGWSGWVIDPIDGTNNFARGIPYWGISLAWIENGEPREGGILTASGEMLVAGRRPASGVSSRKEINEGTRVVTSNSLNYKRALESLARYQKLPGAWIDCLGSSSAIFVDIAQGRLDLYHHNGLKPWDNPAGFLLVREAGGVVLDFSGKQADWRTPEVIAGPEALVREFFSIAFT